MNWTITFLSEEDFIKHIQNTVNHYGKKLIPYDVKKFNSNIIDPIKMVFDKAVYGQTWDQIITSEIFRQRDKSNTNDIGYFHQEIFKYIKGCYVPPNGKDGGWDVIVDCPTGYFIDNTNTVQVHKIYVEMKNKHNTMNDSATAKTYMKMQNQLLKNDDCVCFLVEAIAKRHQNIIWTPKVDKVKYSNKYIRRVSIDVFYEITTGVPDAFYQICMALPKYVDKVLSTMSEVTIPNDTVIAEMKDKAKSYNMPTNDLSMLMAMYMLGFSTYTGFDKINNILYVFHKEVNLQKAAEEELKNKEE